MKRASQDSVDNQNKDIYKINAELNDIIDSLSDGIYITDGQGTTLRINKAYTDITGLKPEEVVGKNLTELVKDVFYESRSSILMVIKEKRPITLAQIVRKTNKKVLSSSVPIFDKNNEIYRIVTSARDVTMLYAMQNELEKTKRLNEIYMRQYHSIRKELEIDKLLASKNAKMSIIVEQIKRIANKDSTVLVLGETGVGKELVANIIHNCSDRAKNDLVSINCNTIPESLFEAELFGYEPGSFTGAKASGKKGLFELANNSTLFLDEVGDLPISVQGKLLRALQEKEIMKIGGEKKIAINVRIIAATNKNLHELVKCGKFREDLYYRLNVIPLQIPPLRERKEDLIHLVYSIVDEYNKMHNLAKTISPVVLSVFLNYSWPGNIRELKSLLERLVLLSNGDEITPAELPDNLLAFTSPLAAEPTRVQSLKQAVKEFETALINETIKECGSIRKAAKKLHVHYSTLAKKVSKPNPSL
jgi:PAS domain S-box-containing protein